MRGRSSGRTNTKGAVPRGNSPFVIYLLSNLPVENRLCLVVCGIVTEQVGADHGAEECSEHADDEVDEAFADEQREAQDANGAACQCSSVAGTCDAACDTACHNCDVEGLLVLQVDAVDGGLGDGEDASDGSGHCSLLHVGVLSAQGNTHGRTGLCPVGGAGNGVDGVAAVHGQIDLTQRNDAPVQAKDDQDLPCSTQNNAGDNGAQVVQSGVAVADGSLQSAEDGSEHQEGNRHGDDQLNERGDNVAGCGVDMLGAEVLDDTHEPDDEDDGDDGGAIALLGHAQLDAQEAQALFALDSGLQVGADQGQRHGRSNHRVALEALCGAVGHVDGQEVEHCIIDLVDHNVGAAAALQDAELGAQHQQGADHAGADQGGQDRGEDVGDQVDQGVDELALHLQVILLHDVLGLTGNAGDLLHDVEHLSHFVADDDLELAAFFHHVDDTLHLAHGVLIGLCVVAQLQAQAGGAVGKGCDVLLAADILNNALGYLFVIHFLLLVVSRQFQCQTSAAELRRLYALHLSDCREVHGTGVLDHQVTFVPVG